MKNTIYMVIVTVDGDKTLYGATENKFKAVKMLNTATAEASENGIDCTIEIVEKEITI